MARKLDVTQDPQLNRFITGVLLNARSGENDLTAQIADTMIERTVEQLRDFFPEQYAGSGATVRPIAGEQPGWAAS